MMAILRNSALFDKNLFSLENTMDRLKFRFAEAKATILNRCSEDVMPIPVGFLGVNLPCR